jgi:LytS/YehU family sensor histidine kinase
VEKLFAGKTHTLYNWVMEYLVDLITQTMVGFSTISYFYVSALTKTQERLSAAQRAQSEMQLKLLQQQVDPHFLFNNLNVLSALVEKDPVIAGEFLTRLAELYRYILQTQNVEVVPVKDELAFAQNYLYLLEQRFGDAYNFDWQVPPAKINGQMIVPAALQGLIENVVNTTPEITKNHCVFGLRWAKIFCFWKMNYARNRIRLNRAEPDCKTYRRVTLFYPNSPWR